MDHASAFIERIKHPVKSRMFLFWKLPSAFFAGVRIRYINQERCRVTVPYKWFSQNPFRSTYFACLSMAAEMSTGALAMAHLYQKSPAVSMLVTKVESEYFKKATGRTTFECDDGMLIKQAIEEAIRTGEPAVVRAASVGRNEREEMVALFYITWSFKARTT
ncbi:MAG: DUF4442 domain-containing protein [Chitinophagaceae bacterium]